VIRKVRAGMIAHGERAGVAVGLAVRSNPIVHGAAIPDGMLRAPAMIEIVQPLRVGFESVESERKDVTAGRHGIGLTENRISIRFVGRRIVEATNTRERAEIMI